MFATTGHVKFDQPATPAHPAGGQPPPEAPADDVTFAAFYRGHGKDLMRYVRRMTLGDVMEAEDVVQETMLAAWRNWQTLPAADGPKRAWLFTVARNLVIDRIRRKKLRPVPTADPSAALDRSCSDQTDTLVSGLAVRTALSTLGARHRGVLIETYLNDRATAETADLLGIPAGTVKSRSANARRALRLALGVG